MYVVHQSRSDLQICIFKGFESSKRGEVLWIGRMMVLL